MSRQRPAGTHRRRRPAPWGSLDGTHGGLRPPDGDARSASPAGPDRAVRDRVFSEDGE
jgi:hypothetical protein